MSDRVLCPFCNSPDTAPYKFDEGDLSQTLGALSQTLKKIYPHAGVCMDCGNTFYDAVKQGRPFVLPRKISR